MEMLVYVDFNIQKKIIDCNVRFTLDQEVDSIEFFLNEHLVLQDSSDFTITPGELEFRSKVQKYSKKLQKPKRDFVISYKGPIDGWMNHIEEDLISLNLYSAWLPVFLETDLKPYKKTIHVTGLRHFDVVNALKNKDVFEIKDDTMDCILIACKNRTFTHIQKEHLNVSILDQGNSIVSKHFVKIMDFYRKELGLELKEEKSLNIVINPYGTGGFNRENYIILSSLPDDDFVVARFIGHEVAHFWANGADTKTYHDWLNESFAEIMAILYLDHTFSKEEVSAYMDKILKKAKEFPKVITKDGHRPEGVHVKGTSHFIELWKEFGKESILHLLEVFVNLEDKDTDHFMENIKEDYRDILLKRL